MNWKKSSQITFIHLHIRYAILSNFYSSLYRIFCLLNGLHVSRVYDRYAQMIIHLIKILNENGWVVESIKFVLFPCKKAFMSWYKRGRTWTTVLEAIYVLQRHLKNCKQWLTFWEKAKEKCIPRKYAFKYPLPTFKNNKRDLSNLIYKN